jgi:antitoxin HigA-1
MHFVPDDPIHPGEILREEFLIDYGLSAERLATNLGVEPARLSALLNEETSIDAEIALRLSRYFSNSPEYWLNLQRAFDLSVAMKAVQGLDKIQPIAAA